VLVSELSVVIAGVELTQWNGVGAVAVDFIPFDMWMKGTSGQNCLAALSIFRVPTALVSKSAKGMAAARFVQRLRGGVDDQIPSRRPSVTQT
jgi:hypothetical protein